MVEENSKTIQTSSPDVEDVGGKIEGFMNAFGEHAPKLIPSTIKKLDKALSTGIESLFYLARGDSAQLWNLDRRLAAKHNALKIVKSYERLSVDEIAQAPMELAVPILEQLSFTQDENLGDILISLLTSASSKKQAHLVHPSMVNVAKNLSPDEAFILKKYNDFAHDGAVPVIEVSHESVTKLGRYTTISAQYYSFVSDITGLSYPENTDLYTGNLISLGLFSCNEGYVPFGDDIESFVVHPDYEKLINRAREEFPIDDEAFEFKFEYYRLSPTDKGRMLIDALDAVVIEEQA